jgi:hypothetical protein
MRKLTSERTADVDDARVGLDAGASHEQIVDAHAVCFSFNTMNRLADAFDFLRPGHRVFEAGGKFLLAHGYR